MHRTCYLLLMGLLLLGGNPRTSLADVADEVAERIKTERFDEAKDLLDAAARAPALSKEQATSIAVMRLRLAGILRARGRDDDAEPVLASLQESQNLLDPPARIAFYQDRGAILASRSSADPETARWNEAIADFGQAAVIARDANLPLHEARARLNAARACVDASRLACVDMATTQVAAVLDRLPSSRERIGLWIDLGDVQRRAAKNLRVSGMSERAMGSLRRADEEAVSASDFGHLAYARGFLGSIHEDQQRNEAAIRFTRQAIFFAQQVNSREQLYRWEWQLGRLLTPTNRTAAKAAYERSVATLNEIRPELALTSRNSFKELIAPVYSEYVQLLLAESSDAPSVVTQKRLEGVRDLLESLKQAELQDYFAGVCPVPLVKPQPGDASRRQESAIIYPVVLEDRIEMLVEVDGRIEKYSSRVSRNQVKETVRAFRAKLQYLQEGYLEEASELYRWLFPPSVSKLLEERRVKTLVIVPAPELRTIPLAALHDGKKFLIETYALATTPAMSLTRDVEPAVATNFLVGGLSKQVEGFSGFSELDAMREVNTVRARVPSSEQRLDMPGGFTRRQLGKDIADPEFSGAHLSTHGKVDKDFRKSFILTADGAFYFSALQESLRNRPNPLSLLVLSACETAAGDDRAALGLAGVALQSGAKSAVASLWWIGQDATNEFMDVFYSKLSGNDSSRKASKAESLQAAQLALLRNPRFEHPGVWSPYLLIGHWQ